MLKRTYSIIGKIPVYSVLPQLIFVQPVNYLAHLYLSFGDPDLMTGQFAADAVKGRAIHEYPLLVARGIELHRLIDTHVDQHETVRQLRALLRTELGLLTPVAIDMYFDHMLASSWGTWSREELHTFAKKAYNHLIINKSILPERMQYVLHHMEQGNWLLHYQSTEGLKISLEGLSRRVQGGEILLKAPEVLQSYYSEIEQAFQRYFPELIEVCLTKISTFAPSAK